MYRKATAPPLSFAFVSSENDDDESCWICKNSLLNCKDCLRTPCGHVYHYNCLRGLMARLGDFCPTCGLYFDEHEITRCHGGSKKCDEAVASAEKVTSWISESKFPNRHELLQQNMETLLEKKTSELLDKVRDAEQRARDFKSVSGLHFQRAWEVEIQLDVERANVRIAKERARVAEENLEDFKAVSAELNVQKVGEVEMKLDAQKENVRKAEERARVAEKKARVAEERARLVEDSARVAEEKIKSAEAITKKMGELMRKSDENQKETEKNIKEMESRVREAEEKLRSAEEKARDLEEEAVFKVREAEQKVRDAMKQIDELKKRESQLTEELEKAQDSQREDSRYENNDEMNVLTPTPPGSEQNFPRNEKQKEGLSATTFPEITHFVISSSGSSTSSSSDTSSSILEQNLTHIFNNCVFENIEKLTINQYFK